MCAGMGIPHPKLTGERPGEASSHPACSPSGAGHGSRAGFCSVMETPGSTYQARQHPPSQVAKHGAARAKSVAQTHRGGSSLPRCPPQVSGAELGCPQPLPGSPPAAQGHPGTGCDPPRTQHRPFPHPSPKAAARQPTRSSCLCPSSKGAPTPCPFLPQPLKQY